MDLTAPGSRGVASLAVRPRSVTSLFQTAARAWLSLALVSLALPVGWRSGLWLPLHLTLAGAVATAISGAMQNFVLAMTATEGPAAWVVRARFGLLTSGVAAIAIGVPSHTTWAVASGGVMFVGSMLMLGHLVARAWRRSLVRRHGALVFGYAAAVTFVLVGATLGGVVGTGLVGGVHIASLTRAHVLANVLGFTSMTVLTTLVTFLPTLLRIRMPARRAAPGLGLAAGGIVLLTSGAAADTRWIFVAGGWMFAAGALAGCSIAIVALRTSRSFAIPAAALHVIAAMAWFVAGSVALALATIRGPLALDAARPWFLLVFVAGWSVQVLLGAWTYLLPMALAGHPDDRKRWLAVGELGGRSQVVIANVGLILVLAATLGWAGSVVHDLGAALAVAAASAALVRAWAFHPLSRLARNGSARANGVWG